MSQGGVRNLSLTASCHTEKASASKVGNGCQWFGRKILETVLEHFFKQSVLPATFFNGVVFDLQCCIRIASSLNSTEQNSVFKKRHQRLESDSEELDSVKVC